MRKLSVILFCLALAVQGQAVAQDSGSGAGADSGPSAEDIARATGFSLAEPAEGPLLPLRKQLREQIVEAEKRGVGIKTYAEAFSSLEEQVAGGSIGEDDLKKRITSIVTSLHGQIRKSNHLKATAAQAAKAAPKAAASGSSGSGKIIHHGLIKPGDKVDAIGLKAPQSLRQQMTHDLVEQVVRQKLRAHPLPGIDPNGPGSLKDDPRVKRHLQGK
ncbi:MAG: hypothetical protein AB7W16_14675 [Candidatus Obscuribacterales bacterium]